MDRHLTVSGFVVHEGRVALHWHRKNQMWLPAGGHIEPGEDPVAATMREIEEEFALRAEVLPLASRVRYDGGPAQLEPPYTILLEDVEGCGRTPDGKAVHVDLIYFCRVVAGYPGQSYDPENPIVWADADTLTAGKAVANGRDVVLPDIQALGLEAIRLATVAAGVP